MNSNDDIAMDEALEVTDRMISMAVESCRVSKEHYKEAFQKHCDAAFAEIASPMFASREELRTWFGKAMDRSEARTREYFRVRRIETEGV